MRPDHPRSIKRDKDEKSALASLVSSTPDLLLEANAYPNVSRERPRLVSLDSPISCRGSRVVHGSAPIPFRLKVAFGRDGTPYALLRVRHRLGRMVLRALMRD